MGRVGRWLVTYMAGSGTSMLLFIHLLAVPGVAIC